MRAKLKRQKRLALLLAGLVLLAGLTAALWPPRTFPVNQVVAVSEGGSVMAVSRQLKVGSVLRSPLLFRLLIGLLGSKSGVIAGDYWFERPLAAPELAWRLSRGVLSKKPLKLTIPEGLTATSTASLLANRLPGFATSTFINLAEAYPGRLLPDTYFFPPSLDAAGTVRLMVDNFTNQVESRGPAIKASGESFGDVLTMASLVEKEAADEADRRLIAGILWKRLRDGMPLQVDVDPSTYTYKGLPPRPINNPSLAAIDAVLDPTASPYWFYIADNHMVTHYAKDFDEHRANIKKYLK